MIGFAINFLKIVGIRTVFAVLFSFLSLGVEAAPLDKTCADSILSIISAKKNLLKTLDDTKGYVTQSKWITGTKQLEVNGHWNLIDEIVEKADALALTLPIINDPEICLSTASVTVDLFDYVSQSNKLILKEISNIVNSSKNILITSKCDSQFLCDSFFFYYLQRALSDYSFYRYGIFTEKLNNYKKSLDNLPAVNLKKKELILY